MNMIFKNRFLLNTILTRILAITIWKNFTFCHALYHKYIIQFILHFFKISIIKNTYGKDIYGKECKRCLFSKHTFTFVSWHDHTPQLIESRYANAKNPLFPTKNSSVKSFLITMTSCDNINAILYSKKLSQMLLTPRLFIYRIGNEY